MLEQLAIPIWGVECSQKRVGNSNFVEEISICLIN